jgi:hypothetical protein
MENDVINTDPQLPMKKCLAPILIAILGVAIASHAAETNLPAVVVYTSDGMPPPGSSANSEPQVIAALWTNGCIVWSNSRTRGGPPYQAGNFPPERLAALLDRLKRQGAFGDKALARSYFGPDSGFTVIAIDDGRRKFTMRSWHEGFEQRTNLVVTALGVEPLGDRKREDVLRDQPEDYRRFRGTWAEIRQAVTALVPATGNPFEGKVTIPTNR